MADLTGVNDTLPVRLGGVSSTSGLPDFYADVLSTGQLKIAVSDGSGSAIGSDTGNPGLQYLRTSAVQSIVISTNNSSTTNIASSASFTGTADIAAAQSAVTVNFIADQPCTIEFQESSDGTHWDFTEIYYTYANLGDVRVFQNCALYWRLVITNTGASTTTVFRLQSFSIPVSNPLPNSLTNEGNLQVAANEISPFGPNAAQLFDDTYDTGLDTVNRWNTPIAAGGGVVASNTPGMTALGTGTTANGYSYITSQYIFQQRSPGWLRYTNAINLEFPIVVNTYRFWGFGNQTATPTAAAPISNGIGFEVATNGKMYAVTYASGTRNIIQDMSISTGNATQPADSLVHKYFVFFRGDRSYWCIDNANNVVATMLTGALGPIVNALPLLMLAVAGSSAPVSSGALTSNALFVGDTTSSTIRIQDGTFGWRKTTVDINGNLSTKDYSDGPVTPGTVASTSMLVGGQYNSTLPSPTTGQQTAVQQDYRGRLIHAPQSLSYFHPIYTTRVQEVPAVTTVLSTSLSATISPTKAGNTIIVSACCNAGTLTIADSASQSYSTATTIAGNVTQTSKIFYFPNTAAGVTTVTISSTSSTDLNMIVTEYSGVLISSPLDQTSTHAQTSATSWTSNATATTAQASELLIGSCMGTLHNNTAFTAGTGWNSIATVLNVRGGANLELFMEDQYSTAISTYAATGTTSQSDDEYAAIATFKLVTPNMVAPINTATVVKSGQGTLANVIINTIGTGSANVTFYDNTTNSGTVIATLNLTAAVNSLAYNLHFTNGLTMVVNSSTADFTVVYD
jgi:hypothetical protein